LVKSRFDVFSLPAIVPFRLQAEQLEWWEIRPVAVKSETY
jgi:hypothetical protein